jgi:hypothetical protein
MFYTRILISLSFSNTFLGRMVSLVTVKKRKDCCRFRVGTLLCVIQKHCLNRVYSYFSSVPHRVRFYEATLVVLYFRSFH